MKGTWRGTGRETLRGTWRGVGGGVGGGLQMGLQRVYGMGLAVKIRSGKIQVRSGPGLVQFTGQI